LCIAQTFADVATGRNEFAEVDQAAGKPLNSARLPGPTLSEGLGGR
jgi:hypothetical protein